MPTPYRIRVFRGEQLLSEQTFTDDLVKIGKHASAKVRLDDKEAASIHAVLTLDGDELALTDVSGARGTLVNGRPVSKRKLLEGDEIRIAGLRLEVTRVVDRRSDHPDVVPAVPEPQPVLALPPEPLPAVQPLAEAEPAAPALPVPPRDASQLDSPALQLAWFWGDQLLQVTQHARPESVFMGPTPRCALQVGGEERLLAEPLDGEFALRVDEDTPTFRRRGEDVVELAPGLHRLRSTDFAWLQAGPLRVEASFAARPPAARVPLAACIDFRLVNLVLALTFVASAFAIGAQTRNEEDVLADDLDPKLQRWVIHTPMVPPTKRTDATSTLALEDPQPSESAPRHSGPEGKAGDPKSQSKKSSLANLGRVNLDRSALAAPSLVSVGSGPASSSVFSGTGVGRELLASLDGLKGPSTSAAHGLWGMGQINNGRGGGGEAQTIGIGSVFSHGRSSGNEVYGTAPVLTRSSSPKPGPEIDNGPIDTSGAIDRDLVRQVIRNNISQVRYCYEERLRSSPDLSGKIRVRFVIGAEGAVTQAGVDEATLNDDTLQSCIVRKVRGWLFPKPKGGGTAVITYPFLLRPSGE